MKITDKHWFNKALEKMKTEPMWKPPNTVVVSKKVLDEIRKERKEGK